MHNAAAPAATTAEPDLPVFPSWPDLVPYRGDLVRYARRKLMDPSLAEDLVHDVFEAVATGRAAFGGRSALRTWLIGILKHKIVDLVRERVAHDPLPEVEDALGPALVSAQPGPEEQATQRERLGLAMARLQTLSPGLRQAFELRVLHDQSTDEVCAALNITEDNLFVRLHRVRRALAA